MTPFTWFNSDADGNTMDDAELAVAIEADGVVADFVADVRVLKAERDAALGEVAAVRGALVQPPGTLGDLIYSAKVLMNTAKMNTEAVNTLVGERNEAREALAFERDEAAKWKALASEAKADATSLRKRLESHVAAEDRRQGGRCDDCGLHTPALIVKDDHYGGYKAVCYDRDRCNARSPG
ncbi:MAG: hypothetical protein A2W26_02395 [Acidobacteria bacterium RBG_16_64_8]|nr:MAG: hypothetical protein A2W26_02395 [Acidobacteria bacterium RBG_16_64_8]